jgi:hypothetical protein
MFGDTPVRIEATDDVYRRLLKMQLNEGRLEIAKFRAQLAIGRYTSSDYVGWVLTQKELRAVATELWANDPKTLIPWLEEFVLLAKEAERYTRSRMEAGADPPGNLHAATRHRLAAEAALWKAKNPPRKP